MTFPTRKHLIQRLTSATLALIAGAASLKAQTVHWGNALLDTLIKSDGTAIVAGDGFHFELGLFAGGFAPTSANTTDWITNWRPLDAAVFNAAARYFTSSFDLLADPEGGLDGSGRPLGVSNSPEAFPGLKVSEGSALFLLVYNNTNMDTSTELFLGGAGTWMLPAISGSQTATPENYRLSQFSGAPVFGGANSVRGDGNYFSPAGPMAMQTATFIPEPAAWALLSAAALLLTGRRRRIRI